MTNYHHILEDAAAYALGALDVEECRALEAHIAVCPPCRLAVEDHLATVRQIAYQAPPVAPPPHLKSRLMARISAEREGHDQLRDKLMQQIDSRPTVAPTRSWWQRRPLLVAALSLLLMISLGANMMQAMSTSRMRQEHAQIVRTLDEQLAHYIAADAEYRALKGTEAAPGASAAMYMLPGQSEGMLVVTGLPPLPKGQAYQLWLMKDGNPEPSVVFSVTSDGQAGVHVSGDLFTYGQLLITIEPAGGLPAPSGPLVLAGDI